MDPEKQNRRIRILHSVAPSQTYILSCSPSTVPIYPLNDGNATQFATVSLRTCIEIIYEASSELFTDSLKDYSVYCMDPLESLSMASSSKPVTVACGLGRVSTIRASHDRTRVTGTMMRDRTGQESLEVVFVLREVQNCNTLILHPVPDPAAEDRINAARARLEQTRQQEIKRQQKAQEPKPAKPKPKTQKNPPTEADRLWAMARRCTEQSNAPQTVESTPFIFRPNAPSGSATPDKLPPEAISILEATSNNPQIDRAVLFSVLSQIDSVSKESNIPFMDALRRIAPQISAPSTLQRSQSSPQMPASNTHSSADDAVVILDKENVNPSAFRRRAEQDTEAAKLLVTGSTPNPPHPAPGLGQSTLSNTTLNNDPTPPAPRNFRKRTLSQVFEGGHSSPRAKAPALDHLRSFRFGHPMSSPPRPSRSMENSSPGYSKDQPIVIPDSPSTPKLNQKTNSRTRLKPYTVPDWARTETTTQPKLSEEAQLMLKEAEQRKADSKLAKRMKYLQQKKAGPMQRTNSTPALFSTTADEPVATTPAFCSWPPLLPVFAAPDTSILLPDSSPSRSPSPKLVTHLVPPCTPPRKRTLPASSSPEDEEEFSLFTPRVMDTPGPRRGPSLFDSPSLRFPSMRAIHQREVTPPPSSETVGEGDDSDGENLLEQELNSVLTETVSPSDTSLEAFKPGTDPQSDPDDDEEDDSDKPFWPGLPPSSPLPQSSPLLQPIADDIPDDDDFELPMASSDLDAGDAQTKSHGGDGDDEAPPPEEEALFDESALAVLLEILTNANDTQFTSTSNSEPSSADDILKELGAVPDELAQDQQLDPGLLPSDINFDPFWNAIGPLLEQNASNNGIEEPDPIKALLSGCVL
ncbi:hypothetical protein BDP27DRAFT_1323010 [Rhodocollybia butyracea]|uniref:Ams2/SPT21 N-terminal domain-containing protein n=1 Tax=Rhodocollybia butyracea TaxID=206335 RepID=A0A9P5PWZ2_9AGAR|nr:hypothetical protein BDP27DRAFT_1323010 [Rhodocollybia butyracea]